MKRIETLFDRLPLHVRPSRWSALLFVTAIVFSAGCSGEVSEEGPENAARERQKMDPESVWSPPEREEATEVAETVPEAPGGAYARVCATCHGPRGEGNEALKSPSIAGLPDWYIEEQFRKFRAGERGAHQDDAPGQQMRAIAMSLTEEQIREAAETVSRLPIILTEAPGPDADIEKGRYLFANECMECHRYNGKGEVVFKSAQLISLNRSYLRRQLENFHEKKRGAAESDAYGNKMVNITSGLSDEEMDLLVDYIGALAHGDDPRPARDR